jgi:hypothetical protein
MSDKDLIKDMVAVTIYISAWVIGATCVAVTLGLFFGIAMKVARLVAA